MTNISEKKDCGTNTCCFLDVDFGIQNAPFTLETGSQATVVTINAEKQASPLTKNFSSQTPKMVHGVGIMTDDTLVEMIPWRLEIIKVNGKELTFYNTGFTSLTFNGLLSFPGASSYHTSLQHT